MPQPPKQKPCEDEETSDLADDQRERGYYYDDSHGYEDFDPKEREEEDEDDD